jgi:AcrR family transcriptional regulator
MTTSGRRRKRPYHHGNLRRVLIDVALEIVAEEGAAAVSLRAVARRAGVSPAAPRRHFATREALLAAIAEEGFAQLRDRLVAAGARAADPHARLQPMGEVYVRFAVENPAWYRVMLARPPDGDSAVHTAALSALAALFATIPDGQRQGALRTGDPKRIAAVSWALLHGLASLEIEHQLGRRLSVTLEPPELRFALDVLARGLQR